MEDKNNKPDREKSIDELAREAMAAIKESGQREDRRAEEDAKKELKAKEEALKQEAKKKIERKLRRLEKEEAKKPKVDEIDTTHMVAWSNPDGKGLNYIGEYNDASLFKISRGIHLFHLRITSKDVLHESWRTNAHTSVNLYTLKEKADKILKESNKEKERVKKQEEEAKKVIAESKGQNLSEE